MSGYDPRLELAPRDVVSQAIVSQMEDTRHPCVYLDVTHLDPVFVKQRFPGIAAACLQFGIDITKDRIPVRPGAHYMIGGVKVDLIGRSSIPRLWAAVESRSLGYGGDALVSAATGLAQATIRKGRRELELDAPLSSRLRRPGGGRKKLVDLQP